MERRFAHETRAALDAADGRLVGHASVFNQETRIGEFWEQVDPGAFDDVLDGDTVLQADHAGLPLARTTSGTLALTRQGKGLGVSADVADTSAGRDVRLLVARGDLRSMSFGFTVAKDDWAKRDDGTYLRTILKVGRLYDVSVVTFPAYSGTDVALRSLGDIPRPPVSRVNPARIQTLHIRHHLHMRGREI